MSGGLGIRLDCSPASRSAIRAFSYPGHLVVAAEGEIPTPCYQVEVDRIVAKRGAAAEYSLKQCLDPRARCIQVVTPYQVSQVFAEQHVPDEITVHHADGSDRVPVEPFEEPVAAAELAEATIGGTAIGYSDNLSFQEAFAHAVAQIPMPRMVDAFLRVKVEEIGGEFGGIAGLHHLYVKVRKT